MKTLLTLHLNQQGTTADIPGTTDHTETWYAHLDGIDGAYLWFASRSPLGPHGDDPIASVTVHAPSIVIGSPEDFENDIRECVLRSAYEMMGNP